MQRLFFGAFCLSINLVAADLLFYESFDYEIGEPLEGEKGGVGFAEPWEKKSSNGLEKIVEGLSYGGLGLPKITSVGGALRISPDPEKATKGNSTLIFERKIKSPIKAGSIFWFSFLMKAEKIGNGHMAIGTGSTGSWGSAGKAWGNRMASDSSVPLNLVPNKTYHWVMKGKFSPGSLEYSIWLNPKGGVMPEKSRATSSGKREVKSIDVLRIDFQSYEGGVYIFDEFRMATSWGELFGGESSTSDTSLSSTLRNDGKPAPARPQGLELTKNGEMQETANNYLDKKLKRVKMEWIKESSEAISGIDGKFLGRLKELRTVSVRANKIKEAQAFDKAIKGGLGENEPAELTKLRTIRFEAKKKAIRPINQNYWKDLKGIREVYQSEGSLKGIQVVEGEINRLLTKHEEESE